MSEHGEVVQESSVVLTADQARVIARVADEQGTPVRITQSDELGWVHAWPEPRGRVAIIGPAGELRCLDGTEWSALR